MNTCTWINAQEESSKRKVVRKFIKKNNACEHNKYSLAEKTVCDKCKKIAFPQINIYNPEKV